MERSKNLGEETRKVIRYREGIWSPNESLGFLQHSYSHFCWCISQQNNFSRYQWDSGPLAKSQRAYLNHQVRTHWKGVNDLDWFGLSKGSFKFIHFVQWTFIQKGTWGIIILYNLHFNITDVFLHFFILIGLLLIRRHEWELLHACSLFPSHCW